MIKACIFDLDGTLCNTLDSIAYFCNQTLKQLGYPNIPTNEYRSLVGNGAEQLIHNIFHIVHPTYTPEDVYTAKQMFMVTCCYMMASYHCFIHSKAMEFFWQFSRINRMF